MRQTHAAGERMFVDYADTKLELVVTASSVSASSLSRASSSERGSAIFRFGSKIDWQEG
jgi:hypothetical protein